MTCKEDKLRINLTKWCPFKESRCLLTLYFCLEPKFCTVLCFFGFVLFWIFFHIIIKSIYKYTKIKSSRNHFIKKKIHTSRNIAKRPWSQNSSMHDFQSPEQFVYAGTHRVFESYVVPCTIGLPGEGAVVGQAQEERQGACVDGSYQNMALLIG